MPAGTISHTQTETHLGKGGREEGGGEQSDVWEWERVR